jgi:MFS transporter, putative metabolite:H+ symporter
VSTTSDGDGGAASTALTAYQRRLILFLSVATFFEGFDFFALPQILPGLRADFGLSKAGGTVLISVINVGTILAYFLVRRADRVGRKPILTLTIGGYTLFTLASGLAPDVYSFAFFQLAARVFLIGEWAIAMVFAAEELPAARRGMMIGVIQAFSSLGGVVCAGVVPLLLKLPTGWRSVFFVGAIPLVAVAVARRGIRETARFTERAAAGPVAAPPLFRIWGTPWRGRVILMACIWGLTYVCTTTGITFWKEFAVGERGFTDAEVGRSLTLASLVAMPLVFLVGPVLDRTGRRLGAVIMFVAASGGIGLGYTLHAPWALTCALGLGIFGCSAVLPVLNAYTAELFPTDMRADAFAWANNLLGRIGAITAPLAIGLVADDTGWGPAVAVTAVGPLLALALILVTLPETRGRELEDTSALAGH